ncbi:MAG TPA: SPOR domain-containing protein [Candidatus Eisenbacteria bacterium]|nr:SPOR domain-containing protein [Candidatus Eisenbacteria bacterium]
MNRFAALLLLLATLVPLLAPGSAGRAAPVGTAASSRETEKSGDAEEKPLRVKPRATRTTKSVKGEAAKPEAAPKSAARPRRADAGDTQVSRAQEAAAAGRYGEAREILAGLETARLSEEKADDAAYLGALLTADGVKQGESFTAYLKDFSKGRHRRESALALARLHYVQGDYAESERLLAIFSPGIEHDTVGREGLVLRGLAQLARGDAPGALQFFASCEKDLKGSGQEEAYFFAMSQAGLRTGKPQAAVDALRVLLDRHAQGAYAPQALYAMGMALEQMGRATDATNVFRQVAQRFPDSYEATRVRDRGIRPGQVVGSGLPIGGGYALQIGAFSKRDLADALARDLRLASVPDVSVKQGSESPPIYRVRAGAFASRDEARALGERLRREKGYSYNVVPH